MYLHVQGSAFFFQSPLKVLSSHMITKAIEKWPDISTLKETSFLLCESIPTGILITSNHYIRHSMPTLYRNFGGEKHIGKNKNPWTHNPEMNM